MWRLKSWLSDLGIWLWLRLGEKKIHIAFSHTKCGSEVVQLANFRPSGSDGEFQCLRCDAFVPIKDIKFRVISTDELEILMSKFTKAHYDNHPEQYFRSGILPHIVVT